MGGAIRAGVGRQLVRGAGPLGRLRRPATAARRAPAGLEIAAGEYGIRSGRLSQHACERMRRLPAGRCHALRWHHRFPPCRRARGCLRARPLRALRARGERRTPAARCRTSGTSSTSTTTSASSGCSSTGCSSPGAARSGPIATPRPRTRAEARGRGAVRASDAHPGGYPDRDASPSPPTAVEDVERRTRLAARPAPAAIARRGPVRPGDRALYATDASNYRQVPIGVVLPRDATTWSQTVRVCRAATARRSSRAAAAPAWPASAATSPSSSTSRST